MLPTYLCLVVHYSSIYSASWYFTVMIQVMVVGWECIQCSIQCWKIWIFPLVWHGHSLWSWYQNIAEWWNGNGIRRRMGSTFIRGRRLWKQDTELHIVLCFHYAPVCHSRYVQWCGVEKTVDCTDTWSEKTALDSWRNNPMTKMCIKIEPRILQRLPIKLIANWFSEHYFISPNLVGFVLRETLIFRNT